MTLHRSEATLLEATVNAAASGDNTLIAATAGKAIEVYRIVAAVASTVTATFKDGSTALTGAISMVVGVPLVLDSLRPWFTTTTGAAFVVSLGSAVQFSGRIYYRLV